MRSTILVVDDRLAPRRALAEELERAGFRAVEATDGRHGWERFCRCTPDLVMSGLVLPGTSGRDLLRRIRKSSMVPVVLYAADGRVADAVAALKEGADDFVEWSGRDPDDLCQVAQRFLGPTRATCAAERMRDWLLGDSRAMQKLRARLAALAPLTEPVLITGERGSGCDAAARALHGMGRPGQPLVSVRCLDLRALPVVPAGASVYLDDVASLARHVQEDLVEHLEAPPPASPRWIVSTGPGLADAAREGCFDEALLRHLSRFEVGIAPLRERSEDVPILAARFVRDAGVAMQRPWVRLAEEAVARLRFEPWPGNVAELRAVVERVVAFSTGPVVSRAEVEEALGSVRLSIEAMRARHRERERQELIDALEATGGNVTRTAERLGRSRAAIYRLVDKHGVPLRR